MKKLYFVVAIFSCLLFFSCGKEETITPEKILAGDGEKRWKLIEFTVDPPYQGFVNILAAKHDCEDDDFYVFYENGDYEVNQSNVRCPGSTSNIGDEGIWKVGEFAATIDFYSDNNGKTTYGLEYFREDRMTMHRNTVEDGVRYAVHKVYVPYD
ncbi:MAG: hypothetical protein AAGJ18_29690 [Bacteroidota bacterium]